MLLAINKFTLLICKYYSHGASKGPEMMTTDRRKWWALGLLSAVQFMVVLDIAVVNVALPSIQVDLGFSQGDLQWVISAYALVFGGSCSSEVVRPTSSAAAGSSLPASWCSPARRSWPGWPGRSPH